MVGRRSSTRWVARLLDFHGDAYQFRHALTREAILDSLLPHVRAELSQAALAAVEAAHPGLPGPSRDLAADLAVQAGDTERAARLLTESGRDSLERGALATAASTLRRAADLAGGNRLRRTANALLVEALALAGRVDECMSAGAAALRMSAAAAPSGPGADTPGCRARGGRGHPLAGRRRSPRLRRAAAGGGSGPGIDAALAGARR